MIQLPPFANPVTKDIYGRKLLIFTFLMYLLKSPIVNHWNIMCLRSNYNIGSCNVNDVKISHGSEYRKNSKNWDT